MSAPLKIFIGYDSREPEAYKVAAASLKRRTTAHIEVTPLRLDELRNAGLYARGEDPLASTEFTYSRFLTPFMAEHKGLALFCDSDFLWLDDVAKLFALARGDHAVWCVKHDYAPKDSIKMDGAIQSNYPRKNWSSLMVFNCEHPSTRKLTPEVVNTASGAFLHRFSWLADHEIGELPVDWNWLEGWNAKPDIGTPKAVHFTRGGPWFPNWQNVDYADLWRAELAALDSATSTP